MQLIVAPGGSPKKVGLLAGSFNPPTRAHLALAEAATRSLDAVLFVLPGSLPHKQWEGASREQRLEMLAAMAWGRQGIGAAAAEGGLYVEIVQEARELFPGCELSVVCGRDAAERIIGWNYGEPGFIERHLQYFRLLVAPRCGTYQPPEHLAYAVDTLPLEAYDECASTRVRNRERGWEQLVPDELAPFVERIYR